MKYRVVVSPATEEMGDWIRRYRDREIMYTAEEVFDNAAALSPKPTPGLVLSLGDGSAVERTVEDFALAIAAADGFALTERVANHFRSLAEKYLAALLQQAKEARDAG